jgi:hypothetical protein
VVEDQDMSTSTETVPVLAPAREAMPATEPSHRRKRWTNSEFMRLMEAGFLREGSSTFLWDGEIIEPMTKNRPHSNAIGNLHETLLRRLVAQDWTVGREEPLDLAEGFLPEPDLFFLTGPRATYRKRHPGPADVALLIEVADTSYRDDAGPYLRKYAAMGVALCWVVHLAARRVEVYTEPSADGYRDRRDFGLNDRVPLVLRGAEGPVEFEPVAVLDVLRDSVEPAEAGGEIQP